MEMFFCLETVSSFQIAAAIDLLHLEGSKLLPTFQLFMRMSSERRVNDNRNKLKTLQKTQRCYMQCTRNNKYTAGTDQQPQTTL
jgi:hypothetical protein